MLQINLLMSNKIFRDELNLCVLFLFRGGDKNSIETYIVVASKF